MNDTSNPANIRASQIKALSASLDKFVDRFDTPTKRRVMPFYLQPAADMVRETLSAARADSLLGRKEWGLRLTGARTLLYAHPKDAVAPLIAQALDHAAYVMLAESANRMRERWDPINALVAKVATIKIDPPAATPVKA
ncbi:hypothetical protein CcrC1_gp319 [Caulobacter phage C1]|nr:hypothetical protein CcrC1_gp319 [Caulobacter phage C1]UTU08548.1 hypothetical protein CcrC2_gp320 [Caulobacter phage C2]UTU09064.1 hypothetical protein CcrJ4_gp315 [Caulobacter phage J4]UTU09623.1 hypothetical protein CcrBL47_gp337 [Caulobacter phage BL47]UTU10181.1 hypothetical protein CcrRB23_gp319 [Caulobacter phage RB23]WGN97215.1 hypothetical protein [Bertelyvirus sp.]